MRNHPLALAARKGIVFLFLAGLPRGFLAFQEMAIPHTKIRPYQAKTADLCQTEKIPPLAV
jgi:hypothetical protein